MTKQQYERWKDFARRMVNVAVSARKRAPSRQTVRENIDFFFECRMDPYEEWRRVKDWDRTEPKPDGDRHYAMCVSSHITDLAEHFIPGYWSINDSEAAYARAEARWVNPISCCVRAGLDIAVAPSAGVAGFTVGDLRAMYPKGVPAWIKTHFAPPYKLMALHKTNFDGILAPGKVRVERRWFDKLPDSEPVWL